MSYGIGVLVRSTDLDAEIVSRGQRGTAPLIGFFEILVWLVALGQVVQNLDPPVGPPLSKRRVTVARQQAARRP